MTLIKKIICLLFLCSLIHSLMDEDMANCSIIEIITQDDLFKLTVSVKEGYNNHEDLVNCNGKDYNNIILSSNKNNEQFLITGTHSIIYLTKSAEYSFTENGNQLKINFTLLNGHIETQEDGETAKYYVIGSMFELMPKLLYLGSEQAINYKKEKAKKSMYQH